MDEVIHQSLRLRIMSTLCALEEGQSLEFPRLRDMLQATDGNLGAHLLTLEKALYVETLKDFDGRKPRTRVGATLRGRAAFAAHVAELRRLLAFAGPVET